MRKETNTAKIRRLERELRDLKALTPPVIDEAAYRSEITAMREACGLNEPYEKQPPCHVMRVGEHMQLIEHGVLSCCLRKIYRHMLLHGPLKEGARIVCDPECPEIEWVMTKGMVRHG